MTAKASGYDGSNDISRSVVKGKEAKRSFMFGGSSIEEGGAFAERAGGFFSREITQPPNRKAGKGQAYEDVDVLRRRREVRADSCCDCAENQEEEETGPE